MTRTEIKVRAAALATFAGATAGVTILQTLSPNWIANLPLWLQAPAAGVVLGAVAWLTGRAAKTRPGYISQSTIDAVNAEIEAKAREVRQGHR